MLFPFEKDLIALFQSDKKAGLKIAGGALTGFLLAFSETLRQELKGDKPIFGEIWIDCLVFGCSLAIVGAFSVCLLLLRDSTQTRDANGEPVNFILKCLYASNPLVTLLSWLLLIISPFISIIILAKIILIIASILKVN